MPLNELEAHPYLFDQVNDFTDKSQLAKYCKLIVGTSPIYPITHSNPLPGTEGITIKANWFAYAFMQYFYGSFRSHFWDFLAMSFDEEIPGTKEAAIELLNKYNICITDVFSEVYRIGYSPLDSDLRNPTFNPNIITLIKNGNNIQIIYFTSKVAKKKFCKFLNISYSGSIDDFQTIFHKEYRLIVLPSPAGGGRTVPHFFNEFPLSADEMNLITIRQPYAFQYRLRYYSHYLSIPCI